MPRTEVEASPYSICTRLSLRHRGVLFSPGSPTRCPPLLVVHREKRDSRIVVKTRVRHTTEAMLGSFLNNNPMSTTPGINPRVHWFCRVEAVRQRL